MKIAIISAMSEEIKSVSERLENSEKKNVSGFELVIGTIFGKTVCCAVSGEGKVNAAMCTEAVILLYKPDFIINVGVAGGVKSFLKAGDVVVAEDVCQHDFDISALGYKKGQICNIESIKIPCDKYIGETLFNASREHGEINVYRGTVATGDIFVSDNSAVRNIDSEFDAYAVEMESASIGQVCYLNKVPFGILRAISDKGDDSAFSSFREFLDFAVEKTVDIVISFIKNV